MLPIAPGLYVLVGQSADLISSGAITYMIAGPFVVLTSVVVFTELASTVEVTALGRTPAIVSEPSV